MLPTIKVIAETLSIVGFIVSAVYRLIGFLEFRSRPSISRTFLNTCRIRNEVCFWTNALDPCHAQLFSVSICFAAFSLPSRSRQTAFAATPTICGLTTGVGAVIVSQVTFPNLARSRSIQVSRLG